MHRSGMILGTTALLACYIPTIRGMVFQWWTDEDMGHGFLVPLIAIWIVWHERQRWRNLTFRPSWIGFPVLFCGAALHVTGALGAGLFVESLALLVSIVGIVLCFGGAAILRAWAFPLLLLLFMLPKLAIVYNQVTLPLQLLATRMAGAMLSLAGFSVIVEGNILDVHGHRVAVVEACSGIRYLLPLAFLAVVFTYLAGAKVSTRLILFVAAVPIAILANALRVALSGALPAVSEGTPHTIAGATIFLLCVGAVALLQRLLSFLDAHPA